MAVRLFGTDGVRGVANVELTPELAFRLGQAAVLYLGDKLVVGRDSRRSGDMLEAALIAGITCAGGTVFRVGIIPTPAIALLARTMDTSGGAVISASHNAPQYNGIKFFNGEGFKLSDEQEDEIEDFLHSAQAAPRPMGVELGEVIDVPDATETYVKHALASVPGLDLSGIKVALDCAHGASSLATPAALRRLGATVCVINDDFNGDIINVDCGSTHLGPLTELVKATGSDVGFAHDGDADRVLAVDAEGNVIDGDFMEAICAIDLKEQGKLVGNTIVTTVMANMGLWKCMEEQEIDVAQTKVGDRYVLERLRADGYMLGGEQSGHVIFLEHNTTGDGLITALQLLSCMKRKDASLAELASVMTRYPQTLVNVRVRDKHALDGNAAIAAATQEAEAELAGDGRILVRTSGTEPLVRVMVEARDQDQARSVANRVASVVTDELG